MSKIKPQFTDAIVARTLLPFIPRWVRPNWLTALRLCAVPFVVLFIFQEQFAAAIVLFLAAALTDLLDGAMARTRDQITNIGKVMDPIADKLLISSIMITMVWVYLSATLAVIIVGLEILFLIGGLYRLSKGIVPQANMWGKVKFNFQVLGVFLLFVAVGSPNPSTWENAAMASFSIAIGLALLSLATQGF